MDSEGKGLERRRQTLLTCPVCHSEDVRRSRKKTLLTIVNRWRGLQRYRCRECTKSFYRPLPPLDRSLASSSEEIRGEGQHHRSRSERGATRKKRQRRKIEWLVFVGMLVIFYAALRVLTRS